MNIMDIFFPIPSRSRNADDMGMPPTHCQSKKCGEYNMLKCTKPLFHIGECDFVVDTDSDCLGVGMGS